MPKRNTTSPSNSSPKKSRQSPAKLAKSNSKEPDSVIAQEHEPEVNSNASPIKKQYAGYVVEEDLSEDSNQQANGQDEVKPLVPSVNPTLAVIKLRQEFFDNVNQYYQQALEDLDDDDDDEFAVDIGTVKLFRALYSGGSDEQISDRKTYLDQLFREYLLEEVIFKQKQWTFLLELSIKLAREEITSSPVPIALLTDLVELCGLKECEVVFKFIEERLEIWKESVFDSCKTAVLRLSNDLLRRLSREQDTALCGKILIFLSNYFPFSERSGLNVQSDFNTENITLYKTQDDDPDDKIIQENRVEKLFDGIEVNIPGLDQMIEQCQKERNVVVDYNLYVKFWSLQEFFREPSKVYNKLTWRTFVGYTNDVLNAYKSYKLDESAGKTSESVPDDAEPSTSTMHVIPKYGEDNYFPKYLTNKRLLELQMGDPDFRKYFLIQLLIVLQYLTSKVKFKQESHVLSEEQAEYIKKTEEQIYELLEQIPPNGKEFVRNLRRILKTEENWNKWKNDGCPAFKKPSPFSSGAMHGAKGDEALEEEREEEDIGTVKEKPKNKRRNIGAIIKESSKKGRILMGNPELTRLWNICPDNLEACRAERRNFMPTIDNYFAEAVKELDPGEIVLTEAKKEVKPKEILGNPIFGWKALRLLARQSPLFFQIHSGSPISPMQNYLEFILKKILNEMEVPTKHPGAEKEFNIEADGSERKSDEDDGIESNHMEQGEEDEISTPKDRPEGSAETEGAEDADAEKLRNLTEEERKKLAEALGSDWKKLASKLSFGKDEIDLFETEQNEKAGAYMLQMWTEQEAEEASVAALDYILEGLGLKSKVEGVIKW